MGKVSKGLTSKEISLSLKQCMFFTGKMKTNQESCSICLKEFFGAEVVFELVNCKHLYHFHCINEWLKNEKICPICKKYVF